MLKTCDFINFTWPLEGAEVRKEIKADHKLNLKIKKGKRCF